MSITLHIFDPRGYTTTTDCASLPGLLKSGAKIWIDTAGDEAAITTLLTQVLELHPLVVEDILQDRPSPKIEDYGRYLYIVEHGLARSGDSDEPLSVIELDLVLTAQWILTHRTGELPAVTQLADELSRNPRTLERGPVFIAHALVDHLVDTYLPIVDGFDDDVEELEGAIIADPTPAVLARIFSLKRSIRQLRRTALHQREVLQRLARGEFDLVDDKALPFFRDVLDHFMHVVDLADGQRDALSGALDAYLSTVSNRMNQVMKTLTIVATLLMPLTFIVGIYGMNFDHMPELHWRYGYLMVWCVMVVTGGAMMIWFRKRKWL